LHGFIKLKRIFLLIILLIPTLVFSLDEAHKQSWKNELRYLESKRIPYLWGRADYDAADCSGIIYASAKHAGLNVRRTTALEMFNGKAGWEGKPVTVEDAEELDILWFTWPESALRRPHGHVGIVYIPAKKGVFSVFHASSTVKRVVVQPYSGKLQTCTSGIKRLTIGDNKVKLGPGVTKTK
jgi:hypothetical protein